MLDDCRHALSLLQNATEPETIRVLWVAGIALARAVGHVLQKVDGKDDPAVGQLVECAYSSWKADKAKNAIFWDFIEEERNQVLKQYEVNFFEGPVSVLAAGEVFILDECMFCPIESGPYAGEDCRDILEDAIAWWDAQLSEIEVAAKHSEHT